VTDLTALKVYSPGYQAIEWGFDYSQIVDIETALAQPVSVAVVPVFYNDPKEFSYLPVFDTMPLERFDLVLFTDIEWRSQTHIIDWIRTTGVEHWLLHTAGVWLDETPDPRVIYRPAWSFNFLRWNPPREDFPPEREFKFECLLGARREHRDFVMLGLQEWGLLDQSLATYRDIFVGHWIQQTPPRTQAAWPTQTLQYPYVSPNLDPAWEVKPNMDNSVSGLVPWEIYNRTWFSVVCETLGTGRVFLSAEKIAKCLQARRLFVVFAISGFLERYRAWGFETFGDVIDESYDNITQDIPRWQAALEQVRLLCGEDLPALLARLRPRLDHNHHRLYALEQEKRREMHDLVAAHLVARTR